MNREKLLRRLRDRSFRRAFAEEAVDVGIPIQIREMRRARGWTQKQLGAEAGIHQEQVARAEKLNYGRFTLATLKELAAAFDCALIVRFASFSELIEWKDRIDEAAVTPRSFEADMAQSESGPSAGATDATAPAPHGAFGNVVSFEAHLPSTLTRFLLGQQQQNTAGRKPPVHAKSWSAHEANRGSAGSGDVLLAGGGTQSPQASDASGYRGFN